MHSSYHDAVVLFTGKMAMQVGKCTLCTLPNQNRCRTAHRTLTTNSWSYIKDYINNILPLGKTLCPFLFFFKVTKSRIHDSWLSRKVILPTQTLDYLIVLPSKSVLLIVTFPVQPTFSSKRTDTRVKVMAYLNSLNNILKSSYTNISCQ